MNKGGTLSHLYHDHLGSTKAITGTTSGPMKYYPFGSTYQEISSPPTDNLFTGQKRDLSTGLYYYGARSYDSALGRFLQPDTVVPDFKNPQSLNRYSYTINNPLKYADPTGHYYAPPALTVTPVQPAPPPVSPAPGPAPVPAPTPGPSPAPSSAPISPPTPQATPSPVPAPGPGGIPSQQPAPVGPMNSTALLNTPTSKVLGSFWTAVDPVTPRVGALLGALAWGSTVRQGPGGEQIYENVGGPTGALMSILNGAPAFTVGDHVFAKDPQLDVQTTLHEEGHVLQWQALGPLYLPTYAVASVVAAWTTLQTGEGFHHANSLEQWAQELATGQGYPWGTQ